MTSCSRCRFRVRGCCAVRAEVSFALQPHVERRLQVAVDWDLEVAGECEEMRVESWKKLGESSSYTKRGHQ